MNGRQTYRILRAYKNRFGPVSEIGIFEMNSSGLSKVSNPSLIFLGERVRLKLLEML
jgi:DNA repair protein RadA/Sms